MNNVRIEDFKEIIDLFKEDSGEEVSSYISMNRLFIDSAYNELMLRLNTSIKKLVIARIGFKNTRKGYGTKLLSYLKDYAESNGYVAIVIESVQTEEAFSFAIKNGFEKVPNPALNGINLDFFFGDLILNLNK
ncbi:GNAT family N-acetyltransferase [Bacillus atrophaeus]|uniref:GNAT family N-acetyltransferase n=1 Tax=Bacillus atrophaeus TaxID=1452 RepID=UPI001C0FC4FB|nr:GNAT family N-acetyltransferase [Bacillus atrophaeus]MBU5262085.1 GNAT family N-acetyltransferase [Bacillus atrophaeus]